MSQENVETVRRLVDGWAEGDFSSTLPYLAPEVMLIVPPGFAEFGTFHGPEGIREFTQRFMEQYERVAIEATKLRSDRNVVLADVVQHGRGRLSGIDIRTPYFMLFTFEGGQIVRMESVVEEPEAVTSTWLAE